MCAAQFADFPFLLDALPAAHVTLAENVASGGGGALYAQCVALGGKTAALARGETPAAGPDGATAATWRVSGNSAAYGAATASQVDC